MFSEIQVPSIYFQTWLGTISLNPRQLSMRWIWDTKCSSEKLLTTLLSDFNLQPLLPEWGWGAGEGCDTISGEECPCPLNGTLRLSPPFLDHIIRMFPPWLHAQLMLHVCQSALLPTQESLQREKSHHRAIGVLVVGVNEPSRSFKVPWESPY